MPAAEFTAETPSKPSNCRESWPSDEERLRSFGAAIDELGRRTRAAVDAADLRYIRRVDALSWTAGIAGRVLIALSPGPLSFGAGVVALWVNKQLQATEVGHTALHGAYNRFPEARRFHARHFRWMTPIDERSWMKGHNGRHHGHTNVAGKDPDIHFGHVRLTSHTPHRFHNYVQVPVSVLLLWPNFNFVMNAHFTGLVDVYVGNGRGDLDFLEDRSWRSIARAHVRAFRKYIPYYGVEYVLFPLLAGPLWWKVLAGNWMSEKLRDVYTAATIYCGHVGEQTAAYAEGTEPRSKGERYAMQVEATNDFEVSLPVSMLCGALDRQIEHHLYPTLPPNRLREIAPKVRAICEAHGVQYRTGTWGQVLRGALRQLWRLSTPDRSPVPAR